MDILSMNKHGLSEVLFGESQKVSWPQDLLLQACSSSFAEVLFDLA